jgi:hypothetical protein
MTSKTFTVVGITTHSNSDSKVRFTHDLVRRVKQFCKGGATRCDFIELPNEMNKIDALNYMLTRPEFASPADQATIKESLYDRVPATPKVKVKATTKPSLDAIKARTRKATTTAQDVLEAVAS